MLQFVVSDYLATGEGMTICVLITMAYPKHYDYEESNSHTNEDGSFHFEMPKLKEGVTPEKIALREFKDEFGSFYSVGAEAIDKDKFIAGYGKRVPEYIIKMLGEDMGNFYYASKFHVNYS